MTDWEAVAPSLKFVHILGFTSFDRLFPPELQLLFITHHAVNSIFWALFQSNEGYRPTILRGEWKHEAGKRGFLVEPAPLLDTSTDRSDSFNEALLTQRHAAHTCLFVDTELLKKAQPLRVKNLGQQAHQMTKIYPSMQEETLRVKAKRPQERSLIAIVAMY